MSNISYSLTKLLSILFTLFFAFAVSCKNADKTGSEGIGQFNGNTYRSDALNGESGTLYYFVLIKNSKAAIWTHTTQDIPNLPDMAYLEAEGTGTDYTLKNQNVTLKFSSDGSTVTVGLDGLTVELKKI